MTEATTRDAFLDGRLWLTQPEKGHRAGHDALLLAASLTPKPGAHAVDLGAGVGTAGLALAGRCAGIRITLVEIDPALAALAAGNAADNHLADRVRALALDVNASAGIFAEAGLPPGCADAVLMNPPFNADNRHRPSPDRQKARAHMADEALLPHWVRVARRLLVAGGDLALLWRPEGLVDLLPALRGFGDIAIRPIHGRPDAPAFRLLVTARKASRAPLKILPALSLQNPDGTQSMAGAAITRRGEALA